MEGTYVVAQALLVCVVPYLLFDVIKIIAAASIAIPIQRILRRIEQ
jgi:biotin transporter BioY